MGFAVPNAKQEELIARLQKLPLQEIVRFAALSAEKVSDSFDTWSGASEHQRMVVRKAVEHAHQFSLDGQYHDWFTAIANAASIAGSQALLNSAPLAASAAFAAADALFCTYAPNPEQYASDAFQATGAHSFEEDLAKIETMIVHDTEHPIESKSWLIY